MIEIYFAIIIGFILGILVGFLMRSESRQHQADFGGNEEAKH
jgi:Na+/H+-dicarboxylate symporter